jgi:GNAT superfamily N-acetyltransferase
VNDAVRYGQQLMRKTYAFVDTLSLKDIVCAFTVSNASIFTNHLPNARKKSIGRNLPWEKRDLIYPAVLIGRLGVNTAYKKRHLGSELLDYIKQWFIDPDNKTGCRYLIVDAYNQPVPLSFYEANGFRYMFSSERQECEYRNIDSTTKLHTRMMYFDLMLLSKDTV